MVQLVDNRAMSVIGLLVFSLALYSYSIVCFAREVIDEDYDAMGAAAHFGFHWFIGSLMLTIWLSQLFNLHWPLLLLILLILHLSSPIAMWYIIEPFIRRFFDEKK